MADIESNIRIDIDTSSALASIKALQSQISQFQKEMSAASASTAANARNLQRQLIADINATGQFSAGFRTIRSSAESFTNALEKNKLSMGEYFRFGASQVRGFRNVFSSEFNTIEKVARERVKTLQTQYVSLGRDANGALQSIAVRPLSLDMTNLGTQTAMAAQRQQIFNQLLTQGSTNLLNFGKNTQWAGRQLMVGFTIPLSIFGSMASRSFMQLEEQAIRFRRVYGELFTPAAETDQMIEQIKELASEFTKYGIAVESTLGLAADAAQMGLTGAALIAQTTEATRLAVLGGVDQQQALETTISLQNALGISTEDLAQSIDFLNAVENQTVTAIEDLTIAIPKAAPVIKQLGGDVKDLAFFLTAMKEGGINASEGANALKSGLASLINPTQVASDMLLGYGINLKALVEANRGDVSGLVVDFARALDELNPLQRARAIEQLFGKFQFARLSTLFQNVIAEGTQAQRVLELANATTSELAQLSSRELQRVEESTTFRFKKAVEDFQAAIAPVGEEFLKLITPLIEIGTKILEQFNKMSDGAKGFVTGLTVLLGAILPVFLMTFGLIANGVANIIKGFVAVRNVFLNLRDGSTTLGQQIEYMTQEQLEAASVAASLDQTHSKLTQTFTSETSAIRNLISAYERMVASQAKLMGTVIPTNVGKGKAPKFADGGIVKGPGTGTSDSILAMISNGEAVIPADAVRKNPEIIKLLVSGEDIPGFKKGKIGSGAPGRVGKSVTTVQRSYGANVSNTAGLVGFGSISPQDMADLSNIYMPQIMKQAQVSVDAINAELSNWSNSNIEAIREATAAVNAGTEPVVAFGPLVEKFKEDMAQAGGAVAKLDETFNAMVPQLQADLTEAQAYAQKFNLNIKESAADAERLAAALPNNLVAQMSATPGGYGRLAKARQALTATQAGAAGIPEKGSPRFMLAAGEHPSSLAYKGASSQEHFSTTKKQEEQRAKLAAKRIVESQSRAFSDGIDEAAQSKSPSRKAKQAGKNIADGAIQGIEEGAKKARSAGAKVTSQSQSQSVAAQQVTTTDRLTRMNNALQTAVFGITSVAGAMTMFGGKIGEIGGVIFQLSGIFFALMQVTQLLTQASFLRLVADRKAIASQAMAFASYGKGIAASSGFAGSLARGAIGIAKFLGPVGMVVAGLTALGGIIGLLIGEQQKQKDAINGLGSAAFLTAEKMKAAGNLLGFTPQTTPFAESVTAGTAASRTAEEATLVETLRGSDQFKQDFKVQIEAIRNATQQEAEMALSSVANQLFAAGATQEQVDAFVRAIAQEAERTDLSFNFASIDFSKQGKDQIVKAAREAAATFSEVYAKGLGAENQKVAKASVATFASSFEALRNGFKNGLLSAEQFDAGLLEVTKSLTSLSEQELGFVLPNLYDSLGLTETMDGVKSLADQMLILQAAASGIEITPEILEALRGDGDAVKARKDLGKAIKEEAKAQEAVNVATEEKNMLDEAYSAGLVDIQQQTTNLKNQRLAYEALTAAGYDAQTAFELAGNAILAASVASALTAEDSAAKMAELKGDIDAFLAERALQPRGAGGGAGAKSPFQEAIDSLREQRKELNETNLAYAKLRKQGIGISEAFELAKDPVLATAIATTKVGTKKWADLLKLIKEVDALARKNAVRDLVREQEGVNALNEAFAEVAGILGKMGMEAEDIQNILSEPALAKEFIADLKDGKLDAKLLRDYLNGIEKNKKIQIQINMATPEGIQTEFEKLYGQAQEAFRVRRDRVEDDFEDRIRTAQKNIDETRNKIEETQKSIDKIQTTINEKQRDIEINVTRPIEEFQNTISDLQRNIEINFDRPIAALQEESSDLANALTLMDREVSDINNKYDKQLEALDKILTINEQLAQEQQTQLDIADALSRGDIASAARAAQELQAQQAQQRADASRQRIEQARELEIERLKTAQGLTRKQVEERQFEISQQIYALEEQREIVQTQILGIQDQIYILEQLREQKLAAIRVLEDQIYVIQNGRLAQLQQELEDREAILAKIEEEKQARLDAIALEEEAWNDVKLAFEEAMQRGKDYIQMLKDAIALLERLKRLQDEKDAQAEAESQTDQETDKDRDTDTDKNQKPKITAGGGGGAGPVAQAMSTSKAVEILNASANVRNASKGAASAVASATLAKAAGVDIRRTTADSAAARINNAINTAKATVAKQTNANILQAARIKLAGGGLVPYMRMGGMLPYKAAGGLFKSINTDTVPAMLTPGEFVVRRFAVEKFGTENLKAINNGTYKGDSMYNYEVNVNVKSDANPDQIARAVMTQIKQIDSMRLKGNRF